MALTEIDICNMSLAELGESQITAISDKSGIGLQNLYDYARNEVLGLFPWPFAKKRTRLTAAGLLDCSAKTIAFNVVAGSDTIKDSGSGFLTPGGFISGERVKAEGAGSSNNNTTFKVKTAAAGTLTLEADEEVTSESLVNDTDLKLYAVPTDKFAYKYAKPSDCIKVRGVNEYQAETMINNVWDVENDYIVTDEKDSDDFITIEYTQRITDPTKFSDLFTQVLVLKLAAKLTIPIAGISIAIRDSLETRAKAKLLDNMASSEGSNNYEREDSSWQVR